MNVIGLYTNSNCKFWRSHFSNTIYSLQFLHWNNSELRYKSIAIQLFMVVLNRWGTESLKHQRFHCMISYWHGFGSLLSDHLGPVLLKSFWCLSSSCCQTCISISPSCPSTPQFSSSWFSTQLLWIWVSFLPCSQKRGQRKTLLSIPKPGFTSALSKIYSFTLEELLFEPALDLLSKHKLLQLPKFLFESSNTQHSAPTHFIRNFEKHWYVRCTCFHPVFCSPSN